MLSWEMPAKNIFCIFCFDKGILKESIDRYFDFSAQS